ncbi:hypothetical protein ACG9ZL_17810 [Acinetobacter sp. ULE_I057]|uniref:hypothetical protein n=1 Tax=Acinetobacter sp. ULE_I057 TaxID=3373070 RepID=UPI003AF6F05A
MEINKIRELALANGFSLKEQASGNMDLHSYVYEFANALLKEATPEGFVLVPKDELTSTYYWEGAEHTVNCVSEYEMELEKNEIAELEKWEQTKSTKAFFANIYSDEDNFEIVEFDSIEAAELAIKENKAMIEAQEQSHD